MAQRLDVLVIGGTQETHEIVRKLSAAGLRVGVHVATEYGRDVLQGCDALVFSGRCDVPAFMDSIAGHGVRAVIDASHPYAVAVSHTVQRASQESGVPYYRYQRRPSGFDPYACYAGDYRQAAEMAAQIQGNLLLTIGANHLEAFTACISPERLFVRVLPFSASLEKCIAVGIPQKNIFAAQGPFSLAFNIAMLKETGSRALITKDGGKAGGYDEKAGAAKALSLPYIVIRRREYPPSGSCSLEVWLDQILKRFEEKKV